MINKGVTDADPENFENQGAEGKTTEVKILENLHVYSCFKRVNTTCFFSFIGLFHCSLIKQRGGGYNSSSPLSGFVNGVVHV